MIRLAKSVTSVSPWHVDFLKQYNPNASLVYNGYDEDVFVPQTIIEPTFDIVYAGKWYGRQMQDPTLLFETLQKVKGTIPELRLKFYTAADVHNEILKMASDYCVEDIVSLYDYVANEEVPELLNRASIVLVLSNVGTIGVMTTKLFEAVGVEKPVLCVRSDDGDLEAFIENENVGRACRDVVQVEQAITEVYAQWKENGFTKSFVQRKKIYTRYLQTEKLVEIIFRR